MIAMIVTVTVACNSLNNNNTKNDAAAKAPLSEVLLDSVLAGHDVAMPKMKQLERLIRETRAKSDSVGKINTAVAKAYKAQIDSVLAALNNADKLMMTWMNEFRYDTLKDNETERVKYLQSEVEKVNTMKNAVLNSIQKAEALQSAAQ